MSEMKKIVISGEIIVENDVTDISTTLADDKYFFLTGIVYTPDLQPLPNAAIKVTWIDDSVDPPREELVGMTFSIEDGAYGISLLLNRKYLLQAYS